MSTSEREMNGWNRLKVDGRELGRGGSLGTPTGSEGCLPKEVQSTFEGKRSAGGGVQEWLGKRLNSKVFEWNFDRGKVKIFLRRIVSLG